MGLQGMSIIEFIRDQARYYNCPICGRNLRGCEIRILNQQDERFTVQVTCAACRVSLVVVLAVLNATNEGLPKDDELVIDDVAAVQGLETHLADPIEADEVLEVHLLLRDFQGSFDELIKTPHR